jgi:hypothetical protein
MNGDPRYTPVVQALPATLPPLTRAEAQRAARRLYRQFLTAEDCGEGGRVVKFMGSARRCWVSPRPTSGHRKGWGRLVHDVSHGIFRWRYPKLRPHHGLHAKLEAEIAAYVAGSGWLDGALKPKAKAKFSIDERRAMKLARIEQRLERWQAKERRAQTAIKKLKRQQAALRRVTSHP